MRFRMLDKSVVSDRRLGRLRRFDERSRDFPIDKRRRASYKHRSYTWRCHEDFDQGNQGACVGFSIAHELAAYPSEVKGLNYDFITKQIYWEAQKIDPWAGGSYPGTHPHYEGTSVLAGAKIAVRLGYADEYRWAFSTDEAMYGLGHHGPAIIGIDWLSGMMTPNAEGFISATGSNYGGHAILVNSINMREGYVVLKNSWGTSWGIEGSCKLTLEDFDKLLNNYGECCFLRKRHTVAQP